SEYPHFLQYTTVNWLCWTSKIFDNPVPVIATSFVSASLLPHLTQPRLFIKSVLSNMVLIRLRNKWTKVSKNIHVPEHPRARGFFFLIGYVLIIGFKRYFWKIWHKSTLLLPQAVIMVV